MPAATCSCLTVMKRILPLRNMYSVEASSELPGSPNATSMPEELSTSTMSSLPTDSRDCAGASGIFGSTRVK